MVVPLIPILIGAGIRLAAPTVAKLLMKKGFKEASKTALKKAGNNAKSINKSQAIKLKPPKVARSKKSPTPSRQGPPKVTRSKKSPTPSSQTSVKPEKTTKEFYEKAGFKKSDGKPKQLKFQPKKTTREFYEKAGFKKSNNKVPAKRSNTNLTKKPESKMKLALNKNKKTGKLRDGIIPASMAAIVVGDTLRNKKSNNNTGTATAKTKPQNKIINSVKPSGPKPNQNKVPDYTPSRGIPKSTTPSSPFGPIETKARNKFIKKSGGKDAFKSDKQIDSLFVNEMLDMREGSEGNSGFGLDDQNTYEAILEERKSRKKAGGKVSKKVGGKVVKRNMGGSVKPRKKTVFRRGGGKALRGFGKATYSNKMY